MKLGFWLHTRGTPTGQMSMDQVFAWNVRLQILCRNEEELELLQAYQLMYGRELEVCTWQQWLTKQRVWSAQGKTLRMLPTTFTTWPDANLRGL